MISNKLQGSVAACVRCDELLSYHLTMHVGLFIAKFSSKINFEIGECLAKLQAKRLIALCACCLTMILIKDEKLAR